MNLRNTTLPIWMAVNFILLSAVSCTPGSNIDTASPVSTDAIENQELVTIEPTSTPSAIIVAEEQVSSSTPVVTESPQDTVPTSTPTPAEKSIEPESPVTYIVINVEEDDFLNVRSMPGIENPIVGKLEPGQVGVTVSGPSRQQSGSIWLPINEGEVNGWVNSYFLTTQIERETFCSDDQARSILDQTIEAIESRDGEKLGMLADPKRGLNVRRHWWNPAVNFDQEGLSQIFNSDEQYEWGTADGSGDLIVGSFQKVILPLLERNLVSATDLACNELLNGSTAGLIQLPTSYEGINYFTLYRPAGPDEIEFDWGSWAIGIERGPEDYFLSFLVHYEWEI